MTIQDNVLKRRDIILLTKVHIVKAMAFPVVMYRLENCTIKKAEYNLMLLNCGAVHRSESLLDSMEIKTINPKGNQP